MKLANQPQVRQLLQGAMGQGAGGGKGGGKFDLNGMLGQLSSGGLKPQVQSWVGKGENQPVTGDQLQQALPAPALEQAAANAGTTPKKAADGLAAVLPQLVDKISPDGKLPNDQELRDTMSKVMQPAGSA